MTRHIAQAVLTVGIFGLALLAIGCASHRVPPFEQGASRYRFTMQLSERLGETGTCTAVISVRDLAAKRNLSIPQFTAPWGAKAEKFATDSTYGARLEATVSMSADGSKGECRVELRRGDELIASRTATVAVVLSRKASRLRFP